MKKFIICNKNFDKRRLKDLIEWFLENYGNIKTCQLIEKLKTIGFNYSTKSGISLGLEDLKIPKEKKFLIQKYNKQIKNKRKNLKKGKLNKPDYIKNNIKNFIYSNELLRKKLIRSLKETNIMNPVYMMIISGARGNILQIKQLIGMRGLMSDSKGEIINIPIKTNLKEGLKKEEYFISCYGARKGVIDTALKTANSGYLTRRLIYASQNIFIKQSDCKTKRGKIIKLKNFDRKRYQESREQILGRILNENISNENKILISKGQDICNYIFKKIIKYKKFIFIRTIYDCTISSGICQLCYG